MRGGSHRISVKATSVIDYCYLQGRGRTREYNADLLGARMSCDVGQSLLENAIQPDLDRQRLADGVQFTQCEIHSYLVGRCKLVNVSAQCDTQAMVVQHRWVKPAG